MKTAATAKNPAVSGLMDVGLVIGASLFVALCAKISIPLPFTPVPLTLANFAVLVVGMLLGPWRGAAALVLYVAEGAAGLPFFSAGPGGVAQLLGPTGGYLFAYPAVALIAGGLSRKGARFTRYLLAGIVAEIVLFVSGVAWLALIAHQPMARAFAFGAVPFVFAEIVKVMLSAGIASRWQRFSC